jgi:putative phage-type endonuclease
MPLTNAQLEARKRTLGASEISAIVGENPWAEAADIWARKSRGADGEVPPLFEERPRPQVEFSDDDQQVYIDRRDAGNLLEEAIAQIYSKATGLVVLEGSGTLVHPKYPWASATPDRWCYAPDDAGATDDPLHGLECKLVGFRAASDWDGGSMPGYVACQVQWTMFVVEVERWDVSAIVGSEPRFVRVDRDQELIDMLFDAGRQFWEEHVLADVAPPTQSGETSSRIAVARWAKENGRTVNAPPEATGLVRELMAAQAAEREAKNLTRSIRAKLCELVGPNRAMEGDWGKFNWPTTRGSVSWKSLAEHIAGGDIDPELLEEFRSEPYRKPRLYPKKGWS